MSERDIKVKVGSGQTIPVRVQGDFIFCKSAPQDIELIVNQSAVKLRAGDKLRPDKRSIGQPAFDGFELKNNSAYDVDVDLVAGKGDYNRQIIEGNVTVYNGVLGEAGVQKPDTRVEREFSISPNFEFSGVPVSKGDAKLALNFGGYRLMRRTAAAIGDLVYFGDHDYSLYSMNLKTGVIKKIGIISHRFDGDGGAHTSMADCYFSYDNDLFVVQQGWYSDVAFKFTGVAADKAVFVNQYKLPVEALGGMKAIQVGREVWFFHVSPTGGADRGKVVKWNPETGQSSVVNTGRSGFGDVACIGEKIFVGGGSSLDVYDLDLNFLETVAVAGVDGYSVLNVNGWVVNYCGRLVSCDNQSTVRSYKVSLIEHLDSAGGFVGSVTAQSGRSKLLKGQVQSIFERSLVPVDVVEIGGGLRASGAVIALIVEQRLGYLPDNYLDHVYSFSVDSGEHISGGFESFQRLGIEDNFVVDFPATINLTIDINLRGV